MTVKEKNIAEDFLQKYTGKNGKHPVPAYYLKHIIQHYTHVYMREEELVFILKWLGYRQDKQYPTWFYMDLDKQLYRQYIERSGKQWQKLYQMKLS